LVHLTSSKPLKILKTSIKAHAIFCSQVSYIHTDITTLILLISVSFEAIWGGGCNRNCYPSGQCLQVCT